MANHKTGTVINCMDGRTQLPVNEYMRTNYNLDYVDTITEPGPVKILADNNENVESIFNRAKISVEAHGSKVIAVVAHYDCAGNPVPRETQLEQMSKAIETLSNRFPDVECVSLWVNEKWQVERI